MTLSIALVVLLALREWLAYQDRKRTTDERRELLKAAEAERIGLLNRIQAPATVVAELNQPEDLSQYVSIEDDEGFWKAREAVNGDH